MRRGTTLTAIVAVFWGTVGVGAPAVAQVVGDSFQIAYGDTVADGVPDIGAGNIEIGGAEDSYTFDVAAGDVAIFDTLSGSTTTFRWRLEAPDGSVLFDAAYVDRAVELAGTGVHTLTVYGTELGGLHQRLPLGLRSS